MKSSCDIYDHIVVFNKKARDGKRCAGSIHAKELFDELTVTSQNGLPHDESAFGVIGGTCINKSNAWLSDVQ